MRKVASQAIVSLLRKDITKMDKTGSLSHTSALDPIIALIDQTQFETDQIQIQGLYVGRNTISSLSLYCSRKLSNNSVVCAEALSRDTNQNASGSD